MACQDHEKDVRQRSANNGDRRPSDMIYLKNGPSFFVRMLALLDRRITQ